MVVFLTPKIVRNVSDGNQLVSKKLNDRIEFIKSQGGVDPFGKKMDEIHRKALAPVTTEVEPPAPAQDTEQE